MLNEIQTTTDLKVIRMEVLQPEISHEIQQATLEELKKWVEEGKLLPNHQVRIKNLSWLKAYELRALQPAFETAKKVAIAKQNQPEKVSMPVFALPVKPVVEVKSQPSEASVPFKLYEEKVLGKSKTSESINDQSQNDDSKKADFNPKLKTSEPKLKPTKTVSNVENLPKSAKGMSALKTIVGFLGGCVVALLLSYGGSYFWIYSLRSTPKIDDKKVAELTVLEQKIYNEKVNLRLKSNEPHTDQPIDVNAEFAKLDKQFEADRKIIVENYRQNLLKNDFNNLFYFSLSVLLILFLLARIFTGKRQQLAEGSLGNTKTEKPIVVDAGENGELGAEIIGDEVHKTEQSETQITQSPDIHQTNAAESASNSITTVGNLADLLKNPEYQNLIEAEKIKFCLLHRDISSEFVCEVCDNNFCPDCLKDFEDKENCCPFCQVVCKPVESVKTKVIFVNVGGDTQKQEQKPKQVINLTVKVQDEKKTQKISVLSALFISLCFSISIAYFWVYEISPRLEAKNEEVVQKVETETDKKDGEKTEPKKKVAYDLQTQNNSATPVQRKCVDPESRETFDCDEETFKALYDHTAKTKSVEDAQKQVDEKTNLILSPILPEEENGEEKATEKVKQLTPEEEAKIEDNKRKFFQIFSVSFLLMFGGLLSTRLFFKEEIQKVEE